MLRTSDKCEYIAAHLGNAWIEALSLGRRDLSSIINYVGHECIVFL
jgi:hypothetical protein